MSQHGDLEDLVLLAALSQEPAVFDLVAYRQQDARPKPPVDPGRFNPVTTRQATPSRSTPSQPRIQP